MQPRTLSLYGALALLVASCGGPTPAPTAPVAKGYALMALGANDAESAGQGGRRGGGHGGRAGGGHDGRGGGGSDDRGGAGHGGRGGGVDHGAWNPRWDTVATASSQQAGFGAWRATDGDPNTEWASGGFQERTARLEVTLPRATYVDRVRIKTGAARGSTYQILVSADGQAWRPASGRFGFDDWGTHDVPVDAWARFIQVRWRNNPRRSVDHASIFTLEVVSAQARR